MLILFLLYQLNNYFTDLFNRANSANLVRIIFGILGFTYLFKQITDEEQGYPLAQWSLIIVGSRTLIVIYGSLLYIFAKRTGQYLS